MLTPGMISIEQIMIVAGVLLLLGVLASKVAGRFGVPALLLFLLIGMLAGSEGPGRIPLDNPRLAQSVGSLALAFILFAGGLDTDWRKVSGVLWQGVSLALPGVLITAVLVGSFAAYIFHISWVEGLLLGSIVSSTDAAAVFSVLRSQGVSLKGRIQPLLELESGSNDPMAAFLTIGIVEVLTTPGHSPFFLVALFFKQMLIGGAVGLLLAKAAVPFVNWLKLDAEGLYSALTVGVVMLIFGAASVMGGSSFLAVYIAGLVMGNSDFVHRRSLTRFHDGLAWLMQIIVFLVLGLLVFPSRLLPLMGVAVLMALFLVFIARPISVFISLAFARLGFRHKVFISWVGLRGAVPIVLATFPLLAGVPDAELYFNVVFFTVLISVLLQGTTIGWFAKLLRLQTPAPVTDRRFPLDVLPAGEDRSEVAEIVVRDDSPVVGRLLVNLRLPRAAHVMLVTRGREHLVPRGSTGLRAGDVLSVLADPESLAMVRALIEGSGPSRARSLERASSGEQV
jgi:cell volume regulation protein A